MKKDKEKLIDEKIKKILNSDPLDILGDDTLLELIDAELK